MPHDLAQRSQIARDAAAGLRRFASSSADTPVLVGFDGFVDSIIRIVKTRQDLDTYEAYPTIRSWADRVGAADGKSANFEFVVTQQKLGGNGPIMANALLEATLPVTYIGCIGAHNPHPVFEAFASRVELYSVSDPGFTDAVEFDNGKLLLGKYSHMAGIDAEMVLNAIPRETLAKLVNRSKLIGMTNWTMLPRCESVWRLCHELIDGSAQQRPMIFVDFADPAKRSQEDLRGALDLLAAMQDKADVVLGMNLSEATQVRAALGMTTFGDDADDAEARAAIEESAVLIREKLDLYAAVVHPREAAAASIHNAHGEADSATLAGPYVGRPKLSTGAGDNFNAGFCLGLLAKLPVAGCLACGVGTSGYYVREARSPKLSELAGFLGELPPPEGA